MARYDKTPPPINQARLLHFPPAAVYEELKQRAECQKRWFVVSDDQLEEALLLRNDPLICLGLAQYGASHKVATVLYKRGSLSGDENYNRALRFAVLGNPLLPRQLGWSRKALGIVEDAEVLRIITTDDFNEELHIILKNPGAKHLLAMLYNQDKPFDKIPEDKYLRAVRWSHTNPAINDYENSEHGPDSDTLDLWKGIRRLLKTLPVTGEGLTTAYLLLKSVERYAGSFDEDPTPTFKRWDTVSPGSFHSYASDCYGLDMKDEFRCLMAVLFGRYSENNKLKYLGSADSPDRALRCEYYSRARMNAEQMQLAYDKDADAFTFAALYNEILFSQLETRAKLEQLIQGGLVRLYRQRCKQIQKRSPEFSLRPVSKFLEDEEGPLSEEQKRLERLELMIAANTEKLSAIGKVLVWILGLAIVGIVLILRPRF